MLCLAIAFARAWNVRENHLFGPNETVGEYELQSVSNLPQKNESTLWKY